MRLDGLQGAVILFALTLLIVGLGIGGWRIAKDKGWSSLAPPVLRLWPLPFIGLTLQFGALRWAAGTERITLFALSQGLLLVFFAANFKYAPLHLLALGFAMNLLPILSNGGYMPITPEAMASLNPGTSADQWINGLTRAGSKDIVMSAAVAPFWFLGDVFVLSRPFPLPTAFSVGDVLILIGFGWTVYQFSSPKGANDHGQAHRAGTASQRGSRGQAV